MSTTASIQHPRLIRKLWRKRIQLRLGARLFRPQQMLLREQLVFSHDGPVVPAALRLRQAELGPAQDVLPPHPDQLGPIGARRDLDPIQGGIAALWTEYPPHLLRHLVASSAAQHEAADGGDFSPVWCRERLQGVGVGVGGVGHRWVSSSSWWRSS